MKKFASALALVLVFSLVLPIQAFAAVTGQEAVNTLRALEIMTGDERGDLHLDRQLTRAQLAKMLCASSAYKNSVNETGLGYSVFSDVAPAHWAGQYIKLCVGQGWLSGYSDGSFRPNEPVKLEEACSACLKLLGYSSAQLSGSYPYAQINKAASIGLTESVRGGAGSPLIRQDAAYLFCSLLSCENASGMVYGQTLGYSVNNGKIDMIQAVGINLKGPYVASSSEKLSFAPEKIYLNGKSAAGRTLKENDVYYINEALASLWIYDKKASGKLDQVSPAASPQTLVLAGTAYQIDSSDVSFELSSYGSIKTGDTVTLLLGMDDKVCGIIEGNAVEGSYLGIVQSNVRSAEEGSASVISTLSVFCTDGVVRSFETERSSASAGSLVSVGISSSGASVTILKDKGIEGLFNKAGSRFAGYPVSDDIRIIDSDGQNAVKIDKEALQGKTFKEKDIRYYLLEDGVITDLILNDATGELWTYALLTEVSGASSGSTVYGSYVFLTNGVRGAYTSSGIRYMVDVGGIAIKYENAASVSSVRQLSKIELTEISGGSAFSQNVRYLLDTSVQVYLKDRDEFYLMDIDDVDFEGYRVTGWYDDFGLSAGGKIRVITVESRNF